MYSFIKILEQNFFIYLEQLELLAFFSGYPLLFLLVYTLANGKQTRGLFLRKQHLLLPFGYAVTGLLFMGLQIKKAITDVQAGNTVFAWQNHSLFIWGCVTILFFIPWLNKKPWLSFFHSLVFFLLIVKDLFQWFSGTGDQLMLNNDMQLYTKSLLLNSATYAFVLLTAYCMYQLRRKK